jgi:hypothetical protein
MERLKQGVTINLVGEARVHARWLVKANPINVVDRFVIWEGGISEWHK